MDLWWIISCKHKISQSLNEARLEIVQHNIEFDHKWVVPREGRGGGLVLFWKLSINLKIESSTNITFDAFVDKNTENEWQLTGFCGEPNTTRRCEAWSKFKYLNSQSEILWLCIGDFNEINKQEEKMGGATRPHNQMQLFRVASPIFSSCLVISLKSPIHNHIISSWEFRYLSLLHASHHQTVSGLP